MKISFACPSCDAGGAVDASAAGRQARCKHCGHHFTIPAPGEAECESEGYSLEQPTESAVGLDVMRPPRDSTFVRSRAGDGDAPSREPRRDASGATRRPARGKVSPFPWQAWLVRCAIGIAIALASIAMLVPNGTLIAGCVLLVMGMLMVLVGYGAGAYGAFHEDFLYGFLYMVIPFYAAYYIVTRWDDLWIWFTCSTVGVGLVLLGTEIVRWAGVAA
jgi:hypothetical protein